jgi:WD40 repeat protein
MINRILKAIGSEFRFVKKPNPRELREILGENNLKVTKQVLQNGDHPTFFGYHDKTPFSLDNKKVLANSVAVDDKKLKNEGSLMELGYFEKGSDGKFSTNFVKFSETTAWSWQQGCMLQWNPKNPNQEVVFNRVVGDSYGAVIFDIESGKIVREFSFPIYSVAPNGKYASSLNFSRLSRIRNGYGYRNLPDSTKGQVAPENDGVIIYDFTTGDQVAMIALSDLAENTLKVKDHYINHITFSPDGKYVGFFHFYSDKYSKRIIRFYIYNIETEELKLLEAFRTTSHYCWRNNHQIITTEHGPGGCLYYLYDIQTKTKTVIDIPKIGDLHPMTHPADENKIVADSKPDRWGNQQLFIFDIETGQHFHVGSFKNPKEYHGSVRCDLHPRWDREGEYIAVDSTERGKRSLILTRISK